MLGVGGTTDKKTIFGVEEGPVTKGYISMKTCSTFRVFPLRLLWSLILHIYADYRGKDTNNSAELQALEVGLLIAKANI